MRPAQGDRAQSDSQGSDNGSAVPGEGPGRQRRWPRRPQPSRRREMEPALIAQLARVWGATLATTACPD
eukprot:1768703-Lingulodinium_polyedra.AAC.1